MTDPTWLFIQCCWIAWLGYWVAMAFSTKPTIERTGFLGYRLVTLVLILPGSPPRGYCTFPRSHSFGRHRSRWES